MKQRRIGNTSKLPILFAYPGIFLLIGIDLFPCAFLLIAFKSYGYGQTIFSMRDVGLSNFISIFSSPYTWVVLKNTIVISALKTISLLIFSFILALIIYQYRNEGGRISAICLIMLFPHFMSWTMIAGVVKYILRLDGPINNAIALLFGRRCFFFGDSSFMLFLVITIYVWKEMGFYALIILVGLFRVPTEVIDAAQLDGASKYETIRDIVVPCAFSILVALFVMNIAGILDAGFEEIYLLYSTHTLDLLDVIDTYIYRKGIINSNYGLAAALSLIKLICALLITFSLSTIRFILNKDRK